MADGVNIRGCYSVEENDLMFAFQQRSPISSLKVNAGLGGSMQLAVGGDLESISEGLRLERCLCSSVFKAVSLTSNLQYCLIARQYNKGTSMI